MQALPDVSGELTWCRLSRCKQPAACAVHQHIYRTFAVYADGVDTSQSLGRARRLRKVGWIFTQSTKARDFIISGEEAAQMAGVQADLGEAAVTAVVSLAPSDDGGSEAHFEAFQARAAALTLGP